MGVTATDCPAPSTRSLNQRVPTRPQAGVYATGLVRPPRRPCEYFRVSEINRRSSYVRGFHPLATPAKSKGPGKNGPQYGLRVPAGFNEDPRRSPRKSESP